MTGTLEASFKQDTRGFIQRLNLLFARFESGFYESRELDEAFRLMHSIKSEAAHLEQREIAELAHQAESLLQEMRDDSGSPVPLNQLYRCLSAIESRVENSPADTVIMEEKDSAEENKPAEKKAVSGNVPLFSDFEILLLAESRDRGEYLYRLVCDFESAAEMKFPKAVLVLNNLEQAVNVIKTRPELTLPVESADYTSVEYLFTSHKPETELFNALQVDQVQRVFLSRMQWKQHLPNTDNVLRRGTDRFEAITISLDQLSDLWFELLQGKAALYRDGDKSGNPEKSAVYDSFTGIGNILTKAVFIPFGTAFSDVPALVRQAAEEQSKEARCELEGESLPIERWLAQMLRDSVVQLLRNAVSHGIEEKNERVNEGKSPRGEVRVCFKRTANELLISITDDGRGIDEVAIRRRAMELGMDDTLPLLKILTSSGFSTSSDLSMHSGRGVGLDIVAEGINRLKGAQLQVDAETEHGSRFLIRVPVETASKTFLFVLHKRRVLALDRSSVMSIEDPRAEGYSRDSSGRVDYQGCSVYTCDGSLILSEGYPETEKLLRVEIGTESIYLLVEKVLFEESFPPEFIRGREVELSPLATMIVGNRETEIQLLSVEKLFRLE